jgi:UDPglucose 6-dehydrogenase
MAALGHEVVGTDSDGEKIVALKDGIVPFFEPGLKQLLDESMKQGRLSFSESYAPTVRDAEVVFVCVGTPPRQTGEANLVAVERAAREVARNITRPTVIVEKSTVPAGTAERLRRALLFERANTADRLEVVSNPEFLREGRAIEDSLNPDRILVGAESNTAFEIMRRVYKPLIDGGCLLIETDIKTAELAKHASNAFLALKISYANALARLCERAGTDVVAVAKVMGSDARIGKEFLKAGLGYGGYCFPKDLVAFDRLSSRLGYEFALLREVARINEEAVEATADKIRDALWNLEDKKIALLGLAFKPLTDDVRLSPALSLARILIREGAQVVGYDPLAAANAKEEIPELEIATGAYEAVRDAHCTVLCTECEDFRELDLSKMKELMAYPVVIDGRNFFNPDELVEAGFAYYPTGRPARLHGTAG